MTMINIHWNHTLNHKSLVSTSCPLCCDVRLHSFGNGPNQNTTSTRRTCRSFSNRGDFELDSAKNNLPWTRFFGGRVPGKVTIVRSRTLHTDSFVMMFTPEFQPFSAIANYHREVIRFSITATIAGTNRRAVEKRQQSNIFVSVFTNIASSRNMAPNRAVSTGYYACSLRRCNRRLTKIFFLDHVEVFLPFFVGRARSNC